MASVSTKESVNTFAGGMNLDIDISAINQQQYRYAEDARLSTAENSTLGALSPMKLPLAIEGIDFSDVSVVATITIRDIGVIFANSDTHGIIYRIVHSNGDIASKVPLFASERRFSATISLVANYEADDNVRIYFAEHGEPIRVINVAQAADVYNGTISGQIDKLNCVALDLLERPTIEGIGSGKLNAGKIQYAYSLYSKFGSQTVISQLSDQVNLTKSQITDKSIDLLGSNLKEIEGEPTGKSVTISIKFPENSTYTNIEIFSIYYISSSDSPIIRLVSDTSISGALTSFTDSGSSTIGELTVEEFNGIGSFIISADRLESKDNILFAAAVNEIVPEIDPYDVRAYAYNLSGTATLHSSNGSSTTITPSTAHQVPANHDCINKLIYTAEKYSDVTDKYIPQTGTTPIYGGIGPNVKYVFTNTYLIESYANKFGTDHNVRPTGIDQYIDDRAARIGDVKRTVSKFRAYSSDYVLDNIDVEDLGIKRHTGYLNYADPLIASKLASYHRDEIYRFGAVLYDNAGNKSDVKWISDIRFPAGYIKSANQYRVWSASPFESPDEVVSVAHAGQVSNANLAEQELLVKPMGLKFEFSNIPDSIAKIEIVRSKRDLNNRTIYAQGVVQKTGTKFKEYINTEDQLEMPTGLDGSIRPHQVIAMGYSYSVAAPLNGYAINDPYSSDYQPMGMYAYSDLGSRYTGGVNTATGRKEYNYTDHSLSPYHYNKNFYLFINPETSFYGNEFVAGIKDASASLSLVVNDLIYPKSTPSLFRVSSLGPYIPYFGNSAADASSDIVGGKSRLTTMHFAADITDTLYSRYGKTTSTSMPYMTTGLVGTSKEALGSLSAYENMINNVSASNQSLSTITDIRNATSYVNWTEPSVRAYISLGKHINQIRKYGPLDFDPYWKYSNGYELNNTNPAAKSNALNELGLGSATFKYFYNYNERTGVLDTSGGSAIYLIYQNGNGVMTSSAISYISSISNIKTFSIGDIAYSGNIPQGIGIETANANYVPIANKQYLNWSKSIQRGDSAAAHGFSNNANKARLSGIHGDGIVFYVDDNNILPSIGMVTIDKRRYLENSFIDNVNLETHGSSALSTFICNMKSMNQSIYGGNSYVNRQYSEYITTGTILNVSNRSASGYVFGGDTYIGLFDYSIVKSTDPIPNSYLYNQDSVVDTQYCQTGHIGALIPLESSINMRIQSGKSHVVDSNPFIQSDPGVYGPGVSAGMSFTRTQTLPQFSYNSAYSAEQFVKVYLTRLIDDTPVSKDYRVYASEKKSNDESFDSWATFKPANYIDVDSRYGSITRMKSYANRLFFWQEYAMGILSVNERSLIQDGSASTLVLGTGDVLPRYDYLTTLNGLHKDAVNALTCSAGGLYWYDHRSAEICLYSSQVASISKIKGVQSVFNRYKDQLTMNIPMAYDKKYNEVLISLTGIPSIK